MVTLVALVILSTRTRTAAVRSSWWVLAWPWRLAGLSRTRTARENDALVSPMTNSAMVVNMVYDKVDWRTLQDLDIATVFQVKSPPPNKITQVLLVMETILSDAKFWLVTLSLLSM
jgi:hypothetical protein